MMHIVWSLIFWSCMDMTELVMLCNSKFALQWPRTVCLKTCSINGQVRSMCKKDVKQSLNTGGFKRLTIHGLWEMDTTACNNNGPAFNVDEIGTDNMLTLRQHFPNLLGYDHIFWNHEWDAHGKTTGLTIDEYFRQTLRLYDIYGIHISNAINGDCNPGTNGMKVQEFSNCIMSKSGIDLERPEIALSEENFFWEIRICFNVDFLSIACPILSNTNAILKLPPENHIQKRSAGDGPTQGSNLSVDNFVACPLVKRRKNGAATIFKRQLIWLLLLLLTS